MILIDETYFVGELSLPNIRTSGAGVSVGVDLALQTVGENDLDVFVDKYVIDYLVRLFGREFTQTFLDEIAATTPDPIWLNVRKQLLIKYGPYNYSPLANYVYFHLTRNAVTKTTQAGEADPKFEYAENASVSDNLITAWNDMTRMTLVIVKWFNEHFDDYKGYLKKASGRDVCSLTKFINKFGI